MSKTTREQTTATTTARRAAPKPTAKKPETPRAERQLTQLIAMLTRPDSTRIDEIVKALDWQAHTVRGAMSGTLKTKFGFRVESEKVDSRGRLHRVAEWLPLPSQASGHVTGIAASFADPGRRAYRSVGMRVKSGWLPASLLTFGLYILQGTAGGGGMLTNDCQ